jgi:O-antigen/teichoic acid export membrane protein
MLGINMSRLGELAASTAKGSFIAFIGEALSLAVSTAGGIVVATLLGPAEYGLQAIALVPLGLFGLFLDWGVGAAITRWTAKYRSEGESWKIKELVWAGLIFKLAVGGVLSFALFLSADIVAISLLKRPEVVGLVRIVSLAILAQAILTTSLSALAGFEKMGHRTLVHLSQGLLRGLVSPLLVYIGLGVTGAIIGYVLGLAAAASVGLVFTIASIRGERTVNMEVFTVRDNVKSMLAFGLPLYAEGLIHGAVVQIRRILKPWFISNELIGNYQVAVKFSTLLGLLTGSIGLTLYPAFSKFNYNTEPEKTREAFRKSVRYSTMIVLPVTVALATLSTPFVNTVLSGYPYAPRYVSLLVVSTVLVGTGHLSISRFFSSQGDTRNHFRRGLLGAVVLLILSFPFIWMWKLEGFILSAIAASIVAELFGLRVLQQKYQVTPDFNHSGRTLLCSTITAGITYGLLYLLSLSPPILSLIAGSAIFFMLYLFLAPLTGSLVKSDIENLHAMFENMAFIYPFIRLLLRFEAKILVFTSRTTEFEGM